MIITPEQRESASRPCDSEQDRLLALYLSRRLAKQAAPPKPPAYLANAEQTVTFTPAADGTVTVFAQKRNQGFTRQTLSLERARMLYRTLTKAGLTKW